MAKASTSIVATAQAVGCSENTVRNIRKFERETGMHATTNHTGKMFGTMSLSGLCTMNPLCMERMRNGNSICAHCFSARQWKMYGEKSTGKFKANYSFLNDSGDTFPVMDLGDLKFFRGESFGDSYAWKHPAYFLRMAKANRNTQIALWTKNPWLVREAMRRMGMKRKPANLQIVLSSMQMNKPDVELAKKYEDVVDTIFTVYSPEYLLTHPEVKVNCGALNCHYNCGYKCYKRNHHSGFRMVNERLK